MNAAHPDAFTSSQEEKIIPHDCKLRRVKYLNNVIEQATASSRRRCEPRNASRAFTARIGWHRDKAVFGEVVGISLLSPYVFHMRRAVAKKKWERVSVVAEPRSAYFLSGPARSEWEHSIHRWMRSAIQSPSATCAKTEHLTRTAIR